jgi:hypothetical protein
MSQPLLPLWLLPLLIQAWHWTELMIILMFTLVVIVIISMDRPMYGPRRLSDFSPDQETPEKTAKKKLANLGK